MQDFVLSELHAVIVITSASPKNCIIGNVFLTCLTCFFAVHDLRRPPCKPAVYTPLAAPCREPCGGRFCERRPFELRKAVFHTLKGHLLHCERPSFAKPPATRLFGACRHCAAESAACAVQEKFFLSIIHTIIVLKYVTSAIFFSNFAKAVRPFPVTI